MTHPTVTVFGPAREIMHPPGDGMSGTICDHYDMLADHNSELDGDFMLVPVDVVVLSRQPCKQCEGWFQPYDWCDHGEQDDHTIVCAKPCPSCGGSGTTPGNSYTDEMKWCYVHKVRVNPNDDVCQLIESCLVKRVWIVDVDALVVQEGNQRMKPKRCDHPNPRRVQAAQVVFGTPGVLPARYVCDECGVSWDDPTERPDSNPGYQMFKRVVQEGTDT